MIFSFTKSQLTDFYAQAVKGVGEVSNRIPVQEFAERVKSELLKTKIGIGAGLLGAEQQQEDNKQRLQFLHR